MYSAISQLQLCEPGAKNEGRVEMNGNRILTQLRIIMSVHSSKFRIVSIILVAAASLSLLLLKHNVAKKRSEREQLKLLHNPPPLSSCVRPAIPASDGDDSVVDHRRRLRGLVEGTNSSSHTNTAAATTAPGTSAYRAQTTIDIPEHSSNHPRRTRIKC